MSEKMKFYDLGIDDDGKRSGKLNLGAFPQIFFWFPLWARDDYDGWGDWLSGAQN